MSYSVTQLPHLGSLPRRPRPVRVSRPRDRDDETGGALCQRLTPLWPVMCLLALAAACLLTGCQAEAPPASAVQVDLQLSPTPPQVGAADVVLQLKNDADQPVAGARIQLEGNMNHAGMKPVFSDLRETDAGRYEGTLEFTMGGDWFVLVTGELADGSRLNEKVDVPGVARP